MTTQPLRLRVNHHKAFSDVERDIHEYYYAAQLGEPARDTELTALRIAARALAVALQLAEPVNVERLTAARETVCALVRGRQLELDRERQETTDPCDYCAGGGIVCGRCGEAGCTCGATRTVACPACNGTGWEVR